MCSPSVENPYSGALLQPTDAKDTAQADDVEVDHIVPLAEAYRSGAAAAAVRE